jgi:hypothetical protein
MAPWIAGPPPCPQGSNSQPRLIEGPYTTLSLPHITAVARPSHRFRTRSSLLSAHQASAGPLRLGAAVDRPGLLFHKLRLVTVLLCSTVALKHLREEAKHQVLVPRRRRPGTGARRRRPCTGPGREHALARLGEHVEKNSSLRG